MPVAVAGDELPLADDPGTRPLLQLIGCALGLVPLTEETAAELLTGPLGGTDALGLRRLRRLLRQRDPGSDEAAGPVDAGAWVVSPGGEVVAPGEERSPGSGSGSVPATGSGSVSGSEPESVSGKGARTPVSGGARPFLELSPGVDPGSEPDRFP